MRHVVHRWDLDKTYLGTEFESLRALVRIPFQGATDKIDLPGVAELVRSIQGDARRRGERASVFFVSASPPQIGAAIREKFRLDGVEIDGITFKDPIRNLMRGRFRSLREQVGYKLAMMLRSRGETADATSEYLYGDDWESDPLIYSLFADAVAGRFAPGELGGWLAELGVDARWVELAAGYCERIEPAPCVRRIFIRLEKATPPVRFRPFGPRLVPVFNSFQIAACLWADGELGADAVWRVATALGRQAGTSAESLESSLDDLERREHLASSSRLALTRELRRLGIFPDRRKGLRGKLAEHLDLRRSRAAEARPTGTDPPIDYRAILANRR